MTDDTRRAAKLPRRGLLTGGLAGAAAGLAALGGGYPKPALAQDKRKWRMLTSWPKNSPGPGQTAERLARRITEASDGRIAVSVFGAGEVVSGFEVFDAVSGGRAEMAHTASVYWTGKTAGAAYFTTVPFGLTSREHMAWIYHGGGQDLWDRLYEPFGIKPFMAGNTGMQMGGWFKEPIESLDDLQGLSLRIIGFGGDIYRRLGAAPVSMEAGEIFTALSSGAVDGAEFLGPWIDEAFGFYKAAPYYVWPGFNKPNGTGECLIRRELFEDLPADLARLVEDACMAEHAFALAEADWKNAAALDRLVSERGVTLSRLPDDVIAAAREAADAVIADAMAGAPLADELQSAYAEAKRKAERWAAVGTAAYQSVRGG
jgi:TRAP-type mannitol/chloroaromatic compound transport system substrate-binding protein